MKKGIDVSSHQGQINWDVVNPQIDFAILRAGYGSSTIDNQFIRNIQECNRLNIPVGVYWFSYALNVEQARQEARKCIEAIKPYNIAYSVVYDIEYDTVRYAKDNGVAIDKTLATEMSLAFLEVIEQAGYKPMIYSNLDYLRNMFDSRINKYDLWYARYGVSNLDKECAIWQYSESGQINGISGCSVDLNYCYKDYTQQSNKSETNGESLLEKAKKFVGLRVKELQEKLIKLGYDLGKCGADGDFGQLTFNALGKFQKDNGLEVDYLAGNQTFMKLNELITIKNKTVEQPQPQGDDWVRRLQSQIGAVQDGIAGNETLSKCPILKYGCEGNIVKLLQEKLVLLGYNTNGIDGLFYNGSKNAVIKYQSSKGLSNDGIVGKNTWKCLLEL